MKTIQVELEVSIHDLPASLAIGFEVPNDYEYWNDDKQQCQTTKGCNIFMIERK